MNLPKSSDDTDRRKEQKRKARQKYSEANRELLREKNLAYRQTDAYKNREKSPQKSEYIRNWHYTRKYGISLEEYNEMLLKQKGLCAICHCEETAKQRGSNEISSLCVDHCHATGKVRGLLCRNCNSALGKFQESPQILQRALEYLGHGKTN